MKSRAPEKLELYHYLAPKYWPTWVFIGLSRLIAYLPLKLSHDLGRGLGSVLYYLVPSRKKIARTNIELVFPQMNQPQQAQLVKQVFSSMGMMLMETPLVWWGSAALITEHRCRFRGTGIFRTGPGEWSWGNYDGRTHLCDGAGRTSVSQ